MLMEKYYDVCYEDSPRIQNNPLKITELDNKKIVDFYLINEIEDIADYIDFLRAVDSCTANDEIVVHINNYGGSCDVGLNIYDCLKCSSANVMIRVEGVCASCASIIMLSGNTWKVTPHSYVMIHSWSGGIWGKWNEQITQFEFNKNWLENKFIEIYKNFLTDEEIKDCLKGKDFYFDADETVKRLNNYQKEDLEFQDNLMKIRNKYDNLAEKEINNYLKKTSKKK